MLNLLEICLEIWEISEIWQKICEIFTNSKFCLKFCTHTCEIGEFDKKFLKVVWKLCNLSKMLNLLEICREIWETSEIWQKLCEILQNL
jgi:hypothetical protein